MNRYVLSSILLSGAIAACDEGAPESEYTGPAIEIAVAPLNLPNITKATYRVLIENSAPNSASGNDVTSEGTGANNVVYLPSIDSVAYGNGAGGDITYIAPCDGSSTADANGAATGTPNAAVTLWVVSLEGDTTFQNPCPTTGAGCTVYATCSPNADTFVEFNLTVMRDAQQGFFDIAVNFEDIFCSAKLDSRYSDNTDIILLHNADGSARQHTAVGALACTHGPSAGATAEDTKLWVQNPTVTCSQGGNTVGQFTLDLTLDEGNRTAPDAETVNSPNVALRYAIYKGAEQLTNNNGTTPLNKRYWNFAINLGSLAQAYPLATCTLNQYHATARKASESFPTWGLGSFTSWPFVRVLQTTLTTPDTTEPFTEGATARFRHALNGGGNVTTFYAESLLSGFVSYPL